MSRFTIRLKRGNYNKMPDKFEVGEPFYLLDMNIMGIGDANGNPQLLVEIEKRQNKESFPINYSNSTLYYSIDEDETYYYDLCKEEYLPVNFGNKFLPSRFGEDGMLVKPSLSFK